MGQLLPVIKNFAWYKDDKLVLKEQLLDYDQSPVIGIGEDMDAMIKFMEASHADKYTEEMASRKAEALNNLKNLDISYEVQDVNGSKVIVVNREEYSCEKILDETYLNKLHEELNSAQIAIGIPFQGLFLAISNNDTELLQKFPAVIKKHYDNPMAEQISDCMFLSVNGKIVAYAGVEMIAPGEAKDEPCFIQTMTLTGATEKDLEFVVFIGHSNLPVLKSNFEKTYLDLLLKCREENAKTCNIKFMIVPDIIKKTESLVNLCLELSENFCNADRISEAAPSLDMLKILFIHNAEDQLAEKTYSKINS
jgi:hypothetical protein